MSIALQRTMEFVSGQMDAIKRKFIPGVKITVMVRTPDAPDSDFMLTDDSLDEVAAMVERRKKLGNQGPK